jgi:hypothetical protein
MLDHDQRFKLLLQQFFPEFLQLFFPAQAERFDLSQVVWLDKEVFADPPQGSRGYLDLVAQLLTRHAIPGQRAGESDSTVALIHVEIEHAESVQSLRSRMFQYYEQLRRRHGLPVLPIVLFLRVGLDGIGKDRYEEFFWETRTLLFEYFYVGLPGLNAEAYSQKENLLAVALSGLMNAPADHRAQLTAQSLQRLVKCSESPWRKFLLGDCLVSYGASGEIEQQDFLKLLEREEYREARDMTVTWYDQGVQHGQRELIRSLLEARFGPLREDSLACLQSWPANRLEELAKNLLIAKSLRDLGLES